jgi:hypothetical protein
LGLTHAWPAAAARHLTTAARVPLAARQGRHSDPEPRQQHQATDENPTHSVLRQAIRRFVQYLIHAAQF